MIPDHDMFTVAVNRCVLITTTVWNKSGVVCFDFPAATLLGDRLL